MICASPRKEPTSSASRSCSNECQPRPAIDCRSIAGDAFHYPDAEADGWMLHRCSAGLTERVARAPSAGCGLREDAALHEIVDVTGDRQHKTILRSLCGE